MYRYHPLIEGLKVNEDGTEIIYFGEKLKAVPINRKSRPCDTLLVNFDNRTLSVAKLVCEAWNGLAPNLDFCATRIDPAADFHYKNLFWAKKGHNPQYHRIKFPRAKSSKIKEAEIPTIVKRLKAGETLKSIAADYDTTEMSISRIRKRYIKNVEN